MQNDPGKTLELIIVTLRPDQNGLNLSAVSHDIRRNIIMALGDYTLFLKAIGRKGLTFHNIGNYDHLRFEPVDMVTYDASAKDFPKLNRESLSAAINGITYRLIVQELSPWVLYFVKRSDVTNGQTTQVDAFVAGIE